MNYIAESIHELIKQDIPNGIHSYICIKNGISLDFEIINYYDDVIFSETPTLGNSTPDAQMLILKFHKSLTINENVVITPQVRKKGMIIFCNNTLTNYGTISMTKRGADAIGQNLYLYQDEFVPATGAPGQPSVLVGVNQYNYLKGNDGTNRQTGGGGRGATYNTNSNTSYSGASSSGTSYCGGAGTGGVASTSGTSQTWANHNFGVDAVGLNGGKAGVHEHYSGTSILVLGGAGIKSGADAGWYNQSYTVISDGVGCGGLLVIYARELINENRIESEGSVGREVRITFSNTYKTFVSGSSSGGGSVNIFTERLVKQGIMSAIGGRVPNQSILTGGPGVALGGAGGNGTVTITNVKLKLHSEFVYTNVKDTISNNKLVQEILIPFEVG